jgi:uncharacterized protein involved in oxidation of intracellular sulfur
MLPDWLIMKYLLILNTNEPETIWNCLRFGSAALTRTHEVNLFLLGPGVEIEGFESDDFDVQEQLDRFLSLGGSALSCGTCLRSRQLGAPAACPISTMDDLVKLTEEADRVLTFS